MAAVIYHILLTFCNFSDSDLDQFVEKVLGMMNTNVNFPVPDPALADIQTALKAFTDAASVKGETGKKGTKARDAARDA